MPRLRLAVRPQMKEDVPSPPCMPTPLTSVEVMPLMPDFASLATMNGSLHGRTMASTAPPPTNREVRMAGAAEQEVGFMKAFNEMHRHYFRCALLKKLHAGNALRSTFMLSSSAQVHGVKVPVSVSHHGMRRARAGGSMPSSRG